MVEGIIYRCRTGISWRDVPRAEFGMWQGQSSGRGRGSGSGIVATPSVARGAGCWSRCWPTQTLRGLNDEDVSKGWRVTGAKFPAGHGRFDGARGPCGRKLLPE